jgi:CheY-like chemotaxis protein
MVIDVVMPGLNGRELAKRASEMRPGLKILYMTGYSRNAIVRQGRLDEGVDLLEKPASQAKLALKERFSIVHENAPAVGEVQTRTAVLMSCRSRRLAEPQLYKRSQPGHSQSSHELSTEQRESARSTVSQNQSLTGAQRSDRTIPAKSS